MLVRVLFPDAEQVPLAEAHDADAKLLIGDAALKSMFEDPTPHHDLGRLWLERTGLPMVYAVFACADPPAEGVGARDGPPDTSTGPRRARRLAQASASAGYPPGSSPTAEKPAIAFPPRAAC